MITFLKSRKINSWIAPSLYIYKNKEISNLIINDDDSEIYGVEYIINKNTLETNIITTNWELYNNPQIISDIDSIELLYEIKPKLSPLFPLFYPKEYNVYDLINHLSNNYNNKIKLQLLWVLNNNWADKALKMYYSYSRGNNNPSKNVIYRNIQDKIISTLNILSNKKRIRYSEKIEEKLLDKIYSFRFLLATSSQNTNIINDIERILPNFYFDKINYPKYYRSIYFNSLKNIISKRELKQFLNKKSPVIEKEKLIVNNRLSLIDLLPKNYIKEETSYNSYNIKNALKTVGLISNENIKNKNIKAGVRFDVVQFDIPENKTFTQIINKRRDIQTVLGVEYLDIEQGSEPNTIKFIIPNTKQKIVLLGDLLNSDFLNKTDLCFPVGVNILGKPLYLHLSDLTHLLIAGTTGSGKSVFLNSLLTSLIIGNSPNELNIYIIDPKQVELQHFKPLPHVQEVITDISKSEILLSELVNEMELRYKLLKENKVRNIKENNQINDKLPYIVCVIDEYADLVDVNPKVEQYISRLGQKARASGIHLIIATQRPSVDIISGKIKSVIPNAISFNLNNNNNYKTVFGSGIPYSNLLGRGDGVMKIEGYYKEFERFQSPIIAKNNKEERKFFNKLYNAYKDNKTNKHSIKKILSKEKEDPNLNKLKKIIANTKETRVSQLRDMMGIRTETMSYLMEMLVSEGWLKKNNQRSKGYELIINEKILDQWKG